MNRLRRLLEWAWNEWQLLLDHAFGPAMQCDHPASPIPPVVVGLWPVDWGHSPRQVLLVCRLCGSSFNAPIGDRFFEHLQERVPDGGTPFSELRRELVRSGVVYTSHLPDDAAVRDANSTAEIRGA